MLLRDLKPDNILLGEGGHIFLTYFSQVGHLEKEIDWNAVEHMYVAPGQAQDILPFALLNFVFIFIYLLLLFFMHFIIPFGKFGTPYPGKATAAARAALPDPTSACWVFSCFCNPPISDMVYRIFNMHT